MVGDASEVLRVDVGKLGRAVKAVQGAATVEVRIKGEPEPIIITAVEKVKMVHCGELGPVLMVLAPTPEVPTGWWEMWDAKEVEALRAG